MTIVILTPAKGDAWASARWHGALKRMQLPLEAAGLKVEARSWTDAGDLTGAALVLPLLAWGYHQTEDAWLQQVTDWEDAGVRLSNPASVLRWNSDKLYLDRLAKRGAPVVPTRFVDRVDEASLLDAISAFASDRLVLKPQISGGAWRTIRWSPGQPFAGGPTGRAMIQPYLPSIETEGELSLLYFGGRFSHAIRKRPQPGDFRVQAEFDGIITPHTPSPAEREAADRILAAVDESLLYARVDLVAGPDGRPALIELELVEPDLSLDLDPAAPTRFAESVEKLCASSLRRALATE